MNSAQCAERENARDRLRRLETLTTECRETAKAYEAFGELDTARRWQERASEHATAAAVLRACYGFVRGAA